MINLDHGYLHKIEDFTLIEGAAEAIALCNKAGYRVFIVTNQGGIGLGLYDHDAVETLHAHMRALLAAQGAVIDDIRYCPHHPDGVEDIYRVPCPWRKPGPGMLLDLMQAWPTDVARSFLVGDRDRDVEAARAAGVAGHLFPGGNLAVLVRRVLLQAQAERIRGWLIQTALPLWGSAGFLGAQGFAERLSLAGAADTLADQRLLAQARQVYVFAHAGMLGMAPDGVAKAKSALDRVLRLALLPGGGFAYSLTPDGGIADSRRDTYTHAFLLFAASWLHRAGAEGMLPVIGDLARAIETLRHPGGKGYAEGDRDDGIRRQNPHMHLMEAFLVAYQATGEAVYLQRAAEIVALFRAHFFDARFGVLREYFADDLSPLATAQGEIMEGGHHYEWVWLLGEYARLTGSPLPPEAVALHRFASAHTHEAQTGLVYRENDIRGAIHHAGKRAWALTEAIKAEITLAEQGQPLSAVADQHLELLFQHFLDRPAPGAWLDTMGPDNQPCVAFSAASNFYHVFLSFAEWLRFAGKA